MKRISRILSCSPVSGAAKMEDGGVPYGCDVSRRFWLLNFAKSDARRHSATNEDTMTPLNDS